MEWNLFLFVLSFVCLNVSLPLVFCAGDIRISSPESVFTCSQGCTHSFLPLFFPFTTNRHASFFFFRCVYMCASQCVFVSGSLCASLWVTITFLPFSPSYSQPKSSRVFIWIIICLQNKSTQRLSLVGRYVCAYE